MWFKTVNTSIKQMEANHRDFQSDLGIRVNRSQLNSENWKMPVS